MADTYRSPLGEPSVPKPKNQGDAISSGAPTQKPLVQDDYPKGHLDPPPFLMQDQRLRGYRTDGIGGTGDGEHKGDKLPR